MKRISLILLTACMVWMSSCGGGEEADQTYQNLVSEGWAFFENAQYDSALNRFTAARDYNPDPSDAYTGRGWCYMKLDNLSSASSDFQSGSTALDPTSELYAGWAFTLNAQKFYTESNTRASEALLDSPNWIFPYGLNLSSDHLHLLKAENYFALGDYANSLSEVKLLDSGFNADVSTSSGQAALADKIEDLKATL
jgi:Flp pilus assembly protein TadD